MTEFEQNKVVLHNKVVSDWYGMEQEAMVDENRKASTRARTEPELKRFSGVLLPLGHETPGTYCWQTPSKVEADSGFIR